MLRATKGCDDQLEAARAIIRSLQGELEAAKRQVELLRKRNKNLERLSITDELTGLYNQRHFHNRLEQEVARNGRQKHPLCLLFFDVDGLKKYNDTYGHSGGDEVLKTVAQVLLQNVRGNVDSGYRCGGDEFAVILPEIYAEQAVEVARRINRGLQEAGFQRITLSFGVAELDAEMDSKILFKRADEAMYMIKKGKSAEIGTFADKIHVYNNCKISRGSGR